MTTFSDEETAPFREPFYDAWITDVTDGDTMDAIVDVGFDTYREVRMRLVGVTSMSNPKIGVDAYEMRGEHKDLGKKAKEKVLSVLHPPTGDQLGGTKIRVYSRKGGSKGSLNRWLCVVFFRNDEGLWESLGDWLIDLKLAVEWWKGVHQGAPRPVTDEE